MSQSPDYHHRINPDLLRLIPCNAGTVLEIGCGAGQLGAAYKRINPACRYLGVELDPKAAAEAGQCLDKVWSGNVEEFSPALLDIAEGSIDCLVYGDILEHLVDPWKVLSEHAGLLKPEGVAVACIPNIQHWSILSELMQGRWRYQNEGLLDRTHLRFFTLESMLDMFKAAGLAVHDVQARRFNEAAFRQFYQGIEPALVNFGIDKDRFQAQASALQYVVRATRKPVASPLLVQSLLLKPVAACNDVRITQIDQCLASIPGIAVIEEVGKASLPKVAVQDKIFIWQRPILTRADRDRIETLVQAGYLVVVEFDDHPMRWPAIEQNDYLNFRGVHAVQTSTPVLGEFFRQFNPEVAVFPNQLKEIPPLRERDENNGPLTIFFGALNREEDWKPLMSSINGILRNNPGRIRFEVVHDRQFFDALETQEKGFTPTCPYARYLDILSSADIALLPLEDNVFNRMKSDLKFIEAAAHGAAVLASPVVYADSITHEETGLLFNSFEEFSSRLQRLLDEPESRRELRRNAYRYIASNRLMSQHIRQRLDWYRHLLNSRQELEQKRRERLDI